MKALKARVKSGRLVLNEPTAFPEGTEFQLAIVDAGDELDDAEREALHASLRESWNSARAGNLHPSDRLIEQLPDAE